MKYILILILFFTLSCSLNKVKNNHGVLSLESKISKIKVNKSNTNDIISIFGPPSTKSTFDNNLWIYIERKKTNRSVFSLGNKKIVKNNVAILEIDNKGILKKSANIALGIDIRITNTNETENICLKFSLLKGIAWLFCIIHDFRIYRNW